jgi:HAD superfamily hydrolase (TIGR01509 family)
MLRQAGLIDYFEFLLSNEDVSRPKPDSEVYCKALTRLGIKPAELAVVEDAQYGVEAALGATPNVCQVSGVNDVDYFRVRGFIDAADRRGVTA